MKIYEALELVGVPVCHPPYVGDAHTYITYQLLGQDGVLYAEGKEQETAVTYAVNIFAEKFTAGIIDQTKFALETAGYIATVETETYDGTAGTTQVSLIATKEGAEYG